MNRDVANQQSGMCAPPRLRTAWTNAKLISDLSIRFALKGTPSPCRQQRHLSDFADARLISHGVHAFSLVLLCRGSNVMTTLQLDTHITSSSLESENEFKFCL